MNDYDDGTNARVTIHANSDPNDSHGNPADAGQPVIGGLYSGGQFNERNAEPVRAYSGSSGALGNFEARTQTGDRVTDPSALQPNDLVIIPGFGDVEFHAALEHGLLVRDADGKFRATSEAERAQQAENATQQQRDQAERDAKSNKGEPLDDRSEGFLRDAVKTTEGMDATFNLASDVIYGDGEVTDNMVNEFASAQRLEPAEAKARIAHVGAAMQAEVIRAAAKEAGVPEAVAHKALWEARGDTAVKNLMMNYVQSGKPNGYGQYVLDHVARMDQTPEGRTAILAINPDRCRLSNGNAVLVTLDDGTETTWANAIHLRKIKLN